MVVLAGGGESCGDGETGGGEKSFGDGETGGGEADDELSAVMKMSPRRDGGGGGKSA